MNLSIRSLKKEIKLVSTLLNIANWKAGPIVKLLQTYRLLLDSLSNVRLAYLFEYIGTYINHKGLWFELYGLAA